MADSKGVILNLDTIDPELTVNVDHSRIVQVITNVLSNAVKFSDGAKQVDINLTTLGDHACLKIRDHGIGIPDNAQNTVFGRFHQVDSTDHRRFEGSGLGMNISRDIITAHEGSLHYESKIGEGTTFFVELPLITPGSA